MGHGSFGIGGRCRAGVASAEVPGPGGAGAIEAQTQVGSLGLQLGNASAIGCPCQGSNGKTLSNEVSTLSVGVDGNILTAGVNKSTAYGQKTATAATTQQSTTIAQLNLLSGLITADSIKAVASVGVTASALNPSSTGSKFVHLVVAGQKIPGNVAPNTVINLAGLGSVTVNYVNSEVYGTLAAGIEVETLRVQVTADNDFGLPVGAILIVGEAYAGYDRTEPKAALGGDGLTLGVTAQAGQALQEAAAAGAISGIPDCLGTNGQTLTDSVENLSAGDLLTINTASTSAFGGPVGKTQVAETTSSVGQVSLLNGLITADSIEAVAQETYAHGQSTPSTLGSTFGSLYIAGVEIDATVPPNTTINLANLGYVVLNEQPPAQKGLIQVNGLHIVVTLANDLNLPVGAEIFVAHADASAPKF
jgi:hypothetical protein